MAIAVLHFKHINPNNKIFYSSDGVTKNEIQKMETNPY